MSCFKVHPVLVDPLTQLVDALAAVQPEDYAALQTRILANAAALRTLEGAGFAPQDSREPDHDAKLPPELEGFTTLKDSPAVAVALSNASFKAAQEAVENAPDDPEALAALCTEVKTVRAAYKEAIAARVDEDGIRQTCRKVIVAGNKDFQGVYGQVWQRIPRNDEEGVAAYKEAVKRLSVPEDAPRQTTKDPCQLYQHAAKVKGIYAAFVTSLVEGMSLKVSIPQHLKKMGRIIEKTVLKRKDDPGNANKVCDIVRGMITCLGIQQIAVVLGRMADRQDIVITRIKDRFIACPSAGGWRDCMINFYLKADANKHICEIQLVHSQMLMARHGLPGHDVYNRVRNADELVNQWMDKEQPQSKEEMLKWLKEYRAGDLVTHGPPDYWDLSKQDADAASSILPEACENSEAGLVELLLTVQGVDMNQVDKEGWTPLYRATHDGHTEIVKVLLANGADANQADSRGYSPLYRATENGHTEIVKVLLANGADVNKANSDDEWETPLYRATKNGHTEIVKLLLVNGADVNQGDSWGETPLCKASWRGHTEIIMTLLANGADVNQGDFGVETPLHTATGRGHTEIVKLLLANGADVNKDNALYEAIVKGHTEIIMLLLANGADVNKANGDDEWETPLNWASYNGHTEIVKLLLANGADVNKAGKYDRTPLYSATSEGHTEVVKLLLANGADANKAEEAAETPLYCAIEYRRTEIVKLLLAKGADVNHVSEDGHTLLSIASLVGHTESVKLLLANGADVNKAGKKGNTPLSEASKNGHSEIVELLKAAGAK
eukprot:g3724.t1